MLKSTRILLIVAAASLLVSVGVSVLSPYHAYDALPITVVLDLASGFQDTAQTYDELAANAGEEFDADAMRQLATAERSKARAAHAELSLRSITLVAQYSAFGLMGLALLTFIRATRKQKKRRA